MRSERETLREGWLIKSPQASWKMRFPGTTWSRKYFVLSCASENGELVGFLDYFSDDSKQKNKKSGTIKLNDVLQVDSYLTYEARRNRVYQWIFDLQLTKKQVFLVAQDEDDMNTWVRLLVEAANLERDEPPETPGPTDIPPAELTNMLNDTILAGQGRRESSDSARFHPFFFGDRPSPSNGTLPQFPQPVHDRSMDSMGSFDRISEDHPPSNYYTPSDRQRERAGSTGQQSIRGAHSTGMVGQMRSAPSLPSPSSETSPEGYVKLVDCHSAAPRAGYKGRLPQEVGPIEDGPPKTPAPLPLHSRGHSSDSTASAPLSSSSGSNPSLHHLSARSASFGTNGPLTRTTGLKQGGSSNVLDSVIPVPVPPDRSHPTSFGKLYSNQSDNNILVSRKLLQGFDPQPNTQPNNFGSLKRPHNRSSVEPNNNNNPGSGNRNFHHSNSALTLGSNPSRSGFSSLPRMYRPERCNGNSIIDEEVPPPEIIAPAKPTDSSFGFIPSPKRGYTPMTGKIAVYEHMSPFAGSFSDDEGEETPKATELTSPPFSQKTLNTDSDSGPESVNPAGVTYWDFEKSSPPARVAPSASTPASQVRPPSPVYANKERLVSTRSAAAAAQAPPVPDRSLKPSRQRSSQCSDPPLLPVKSPTKKEMNHKLGPGWKVERQSSFVRKHTGANKAANQVPKLLPKTSLQKKRGHKTPLSPTSPATAAHATTSIRVSSKSESEHVGSSSSSHPIPIHARSHKTIEYIQVETSTPPSARTPSPFLPHSVSANHRGPSDELDGSDASYSVRYTDINLSATKAVKELVNSRSLDRSTLKKETGKFSAKQK